MVKEVFVMKATNNTMDGVACGMSMGQMALVLIVMAVLSLGMLWLMANASMHNALWLAYTDVGQKGAVWRR